MQKSYTKEDVIKELAEVTEDNFYKVKFDKSQGCALKTKCTDKGTSFIFNLRRIHGSVKFDNLVNDCLNETVRI